MQEFHLKFLARSAGSYEDLMRNSNNYETVFIIENLNSLYVIVAKKQNRTDKLILNL